MKYYYMALLLWIAGLLMCMSIILIPLYVYLRDNDRKWQEPFMWAYFKS